MAPRAPGRLLLGVAAVGHPVGRKARGVTAHALAGRYFTLTTVAGSSRIGPPPGLSYKRMLRIT